MKKELNAETLSAQRGKEVKDSELKM